MGPRTTRLLLPRRPLALRRSGDRGGPHRPPLLVRGASLRRGFTRGAKPGILTEVGLWRSWERASMAWKRSSVRSRSGPPITSIISVTRPLPRLCHNLVSNSGTIPQTGFFSGVIPRSGQCLPSSVLAVESFVALPREVLRASFAPVLPASYCRGVHPPAQGNRLMPPPAEGRGAREPAHLPSGSSVAKRGSTYHPADLPVAVGRTRADGVWTRLPCYAPQEAAFTVFPTARSTG